MKKIIIAVAIVLTAGTVAVSTTKDNVLKTVKTEKAIRTVDKDFIGTAD